MASSFLCLVSSFLKSRSACRKRTASVFAFALHILSSPLLVRSEICCHVSVPRCRLSLLLVLFLEGPFRVPAKQQPHTVPAFAFVSQKLPMPISVSQKFSCIQKQCCVFSWVCCCSTFFLWLLCRCRHFCELLFVFFPCMSLCLVLSLNILYCPLCGLILDLCTL